MTEERARRKLTAILSADVKGYSRLMGEDEDGTVQVLKEYREIHDELLRDMEIIENINNLVEDEYHELVDDE